MKQEERNEQNVLFLCTGNYYRSRFAEILFNIYTRDRGVPWNAVSRGIAVDLGINNVGPVSWAVVLGLEERGYQLPGEPDGPRELKYDDLQNADRIIALNEREHRLLISQRFPEWTDRMEYWNIEDLDRSSPAVAMNIMDLNIQRLISRLQNDY